MIAGITNTTNGLLFLSFFKQDFSTFLNTFGPIGKMAKSKVLLTA